VTSIIAVIALMVRPNLPVMLKPIASMRRVGGGRSSDLADTDPRLLSAAQ